MAGIEESIGSFFDFFVDTGKAVLSKVTEVELEAYEQDKIGDKRKAEAVADAARDDALAGIPNPINISVPDSIYGVPADDIAKYASILAIAMLGTAALLLFRKR